VFSCGGFCGAFAIHIFGQRLRQIRSVKFLEPYIMRTKQLQCFLTAVLVLLLFSFGAQGKGRPFITRWKGEAGKELYIPIKGENYKLVIKKADGTVLKTETSLTLRDKETYKFTPSKDGELLIEAGPEGVRSFFCWYGESAEALLRIEQFGTVQWQTMQYAFHGCKNMQFASGIDTPDLNKVTNMGAMFANCTSFNQPLNSWDVSKVTHMSYMFSGCTSFNQPLNNWNVSKVTDMSGMFSGCASFNQPLNNWNVSKVTGMWQMFRGCTSFNQPLNSWDVSKVTNMSYMFSGCTSFNQPLNNWNVSKVWTMEDMFSGCTAFNQDLGMWNLEKCEELVLDNSGISEANYSKSLVGWAEQANIKQGLYLSARRLKYNASGKAARKKLIESKNWSIIDVIDENGRPFITRWKGEAGKELRIPIVGHNYKLVIKKPDGTILKTVPSLTSHSYHFYRFTPSKDDELLIEAGPVGVRSFQMKSRSEEGSAEALLRVEQFGTVQWQTMENAFIGCENMQFAANIDVPDLSRVTDMSYMFRGCTSFNQPLNNWDVSKVTYMSNMFANCTSFNQPLNNWNVSQVTRMWGMFQGCTSFNQSLNSWDVSMVTSMGSMLQGCTFFNQSLNSWDVSMVTDMSSMLQGCTFFNQPLNNWDVSKVWSMKDMFCGCSSFNQELGMWKLEKCQYLGLNSCGMSAENYGKSLEGWAAQTNIKSGLELNAAGLKLKYSTESKKAREKLINSKKWKIIGDELVIIRATGVILSQTELPLLKGATETLIATVVPSDATNKRVRWSSTNTAVATVENGTVTAVSAGNATITVTTEDGNHTARCEVVVVTDPVPVTGVSLSQTKLPLLRGATAKLTATVSPADATNKKVRWSSNNTAVAIVENGTIAAVSVGNATITVTTEDGNHTARCEVVVTDPVPAASVTLSQTELILRKGATAKLTATVLPTDATNKKVRWNSNNTAVAIVESGTVAALSAGNATITVTTEDGNYTARCEVVVTDPIPVSGVSLSQTELSLVKGATATLRATVVPSDATNQKVRWSSNNTAVATVENGTVTAVSGGNATITVTTEDGNHTATCSVAVEATSAVEDVVFASVVVSPNPFGEQLCITYGDLRGQYVLYNAQGVVVASGGLEDGETRINTVSFTAGVYLLCLTAENGATKNYTVVKD